jgi:hypothetical protein
MSIEIEVRADGKILVVRASGKLTGEDYQRFGPEVERQIEKHGKIRVLFDMHDFHGWTASALWQDIRFDMRHFRDIDRLALVGERTWEQGMAAFCRPFTTATIRYFDRGEATEAESWIAADLPVEHSTASGAT